MGAVLLLGDGPVLASERDMIKALNRRATQRSFVLPGWGQYHKGYHARGLALGAVELAALSGAYISFQSAKDSEKDFRNGLAPYSRHTRKVDRANYFATAALAVWVYSVLDAYLGEPSPRVILLPKATDSGWQMLAQHRF